MKERASMGRVLIVAALVGAGAMAGALEAGEGGLVAMFLVCFALGTYALDGEVRRYAKEWLRKAPARSPGASPAAPSSAHTSAPGWDANRGQPAD